MRSFTSFRMTMVALRLRKIVDLDEILHFVQDDNSNVDRMTTATMN